MNLSLIELIIAFVIVMLVAKVAEVLLGISEKKKPVEPARDTQIDAPKKARRNVGHTAPEQETVMAVRKFAPAFAEETDWSVYDAPAVTRNKVSKKRKPKTAKAVVKVETETTAVEVKAEASTKKPRKPPAMSLEEFKKNRSDRSTDAAQYEEI